MVRELRKRASRPNYAALANYGDENGAGPSTIPLVDEDTVDSGSDFELPENKDEDVEAETDAEFDHEDDEEDEETLPQDVEDVDRILSENISEPDLQGPSHRTTPSGKKGYSKSGVSQRRNSRKKSVILAPGLSHNPTPQNYALPSIHHRHRAVPIFSRDGKTERLAKKPRLLSSAEVVMTNSWSHSSVISDRVNKSWGYNVGYGPLWELLEDRGWFKETQEQEGKETEAYRRPKVHQDVKQSEDIEILNFDNAFPYLPSATDFQPETTPPPIQCSFDPLGKQSKLTLSMFDTVNIDTFYPGSHSIVFDAGAPVWGLDWCPIHPDERSSENYKQYLAVGPSVARKNTSFIDKKKRRPAKACIQIWSIGPSTINGDVDETTTSSDPEEHASSLSMKCEMVLCIDSGASHDLKWCPLPSHDSSKVDTDDPRPVRKLGLLGGTFEDGSLSIFVVPHPADIAAKLGEDHDHSKPVFVKLSEPLLRFELEDAACWSMSWANSEVIAVGCTNGSIAVFNIKEAIRDKRGNPAHRILPTHYFTAHQSAIRAIAWVRAPVVAGTGESTTDDPTVIASGGYDGMECVTDIRDGCTNFMNRTRDVVNSVCYSTYYGGPITIDQENTVKAYSLAPTMLGRGHRLLEPDGPVWSVTASDYHPQLAIGVADGSCLTTNTSRSTRRGGAVPFLVHKVYQVDYSRDTEEYRMLEHFLPTEVQDRPSATRANRVLPAGTGAWSPEVGVQRVVWNEGNGLSNAPFLASSTGSGLCRIDFLEGRWMKDRIPYGGIEGIREEGNAEDFMDEDSD
ncbi:hypothetical protein C8Q75DRAFT_738495 [Abortiporus biennis]|nr:hypothetical protein C8Q75DRAFT_738495 [Abortiporus biennis]